MTPQQKIRHAILLKAAQLSDRSAPDVTEANVDALYEALAVNWGDQDAREEVRGDHVETGLRCESHRSYDSTAVAGQMPDGSWVGWTYWYGGGKHGDPGSMPWMDAAYDLECREEEKIVVVRTFAKATPDSMPPMPYPAL